MLGRDAQEVVRRFWDEVYNQARLASVDDLAEREFTLHDIGAASTFDVDGLKRLVTDIHDLIQDFTVAVGEQHEAAGDRVVSRLTFSACKPGTDPEYDGPAAILTYQGIAISLVPGDRLRRVDLLWESTRAENELEPPRPPDPTDRWRWPPWRSG